MIEFCVGAVFGFLTGAWCAWTYGRNQALFQCVLDMLHESPEPMYGLDMVKKSGGQLQRGTIYVLLGRMQDHGLVVMTGTGPDGRCRYALAQPSDIESEQ